MKCPNCHHDTSGKRYWCQECDNVFDYPPTETWNYLEYVLVWLNEQKHVLTSGQYRKLRQSVHSQQSKLEVDLRIPELQAIEMAAEADAAAAAREAEAALLAETAVPELEPVAPVDVMEIVEPEPPPVESVVPVAAVEVVKETAVSPPSPPSTKRVSRPSPKPAPQPQKRTEPRVKRPSVDWGSAWDKLVAAAVSGALLTGLLYLGAFMIVVAAAVLAISFWDDIPTVLQLAFIAMVPTTFYVFGWLTRWKLSLEQAGGVLTGIGMLLVAVDFAAVYQFGNLAERGLDLPLYWFISSIICTLIFAVTAWKSPSEFFGYVTLIGMTSVLVAFVVLIGLPIAWIAAAVAFSGLLMLGITTKIEQEPVRFPNLAKSGRRFSYVVLPLSQLAAIVIPGGFSFAQVVTFLLAAVGYGWLAWVHQSLLFAYAAIWSPLAAMVIGWLAAGVSSEWAATGTALLSAIYIVIGWRSSMWISDKFLKRNQVITAVNVTGFSLLFLATLGGLATIAIHFVYTYSLASWSGIAALLLSTLILAGSARLYREPRFILVASGLFILPYAIVLTHLITTAGWEQWTAWLMLSWVVLALVYMGLAVLFSRRQENVPYVTFLNLWAQLLVPAALVGLVSNYFLNSLAINAIWFDIQPTLLVLGMAILFYTIAAVLHHLRHPALSPAVKGIVAEVERPLFLWPIGLLIPVWLTVAWSGSVFVDAWLGVALAGLGLMYVVGGKILARVHPTYRLPCHTYAYLLVTVSIYTALGNTVALLLTLLLSVTVLALLSYLYQRAWETAVAGILFLWTVLLLLTLTPWPLHVYTLVYVLLAALAYVPLGIWLWRMGDDVPWRSHALALLGIGYGVAALSVLVSALGNVVIYSGIAVLVPLIAAVLTLYSLYYFRKVQVVKRPFAWVSVALVILTYAELSELLNIPQNTMALAWVGFALALMLFERLLSLRLRASAFNFRWMLPMCLPLQVSVAVLWLLGLSLTAVTTQKALMKSVDLIVMPAILAQSVAVIMLIVGARLYRTQWLLFLEPIVVFFPVTIAALTYGQGVWDNSLGMTTIWVTLALVHLITAVLLDKRPIRYAHALYFGAYGLLIFTTYVTIPDRVANLVAFGAAIVVALMSQWLVHNDRHHTFNDFSQHFMQKEDVSEKKSLRALFLFIAIYAFPVWLFLLLLQLNLSLAWVSVALALMLSERLFSRRLQSPTTYGVWRTALCLPWKIGAALFWVIGVGLTIPTTTQMLFGYKVLNVQTVIMVQLIATITLILAARLYRMKWFMFLEPVVAFFPITLFLMAYGPGMWGELLGLTIVWTGLALVHLVTAVLLDNRPIRYAHGLYLCGYGLLLFVLVASATDRVANLVVLGTVIVVALVSHWLAHNGRHRTFDELRHLLLLDEEEMANRLSKTFFLFVGIYLFPVWLVMLLVELNVSMAWWGLALAVLAPIYIFMGLRSRRTLNVYAWPFYSAGYVLTVIGAIFAIGDVTMLIVVLSLNTLVYAVTAAIFKQPFWLYLSAILIPVVDLLILYDTDALTRTWVASTFTALAFLYLLLGAILDQRFVMNPLAKSSRLPPHLLRRENLADISAYALSFYAGAYILSTMALVIPLGDRMLTIGIFSAAVIFYMLSVRLFNKTIFYYAVAWLATVPYHLFITATPLPARWWGLSWIPLIIAYIVIGKTIFAREQPEKWRSRVALTSPALPFYLVAYVMSLSMMLLSQSDPLAFTLSLAAGSVLYFVSASLFQHPAWFYPGLFTAHISLAAFFTINPSNSPVPMIAIPYLAATWVTALVGYWLSREYPVTHKLPGGERVFSFYKWEFSFGGWPFLGHLLTPSWAQPFFLFAVLDIVVWQLVALGMAQTAVLFALGIFLLLGLFAMLWRDKALPVGSIAFFLLAVVVRLTSLDMRFGTRLVWLGGIGLGFYLLSVLLSRLTHERPEYRLTLWIRPLLGTAVFLTAITAIISLPLILIDTPATAFCLAFAGLLYLTIAYRGQYRRLGYAAAAVLQLAWILLLISQEVQEPQFYAIPAGLYFFAIGVLERRRGRYLFACYLEGFGLTIMMLTSFIQSLNPDGFFYFVLLMAECLIIIGSSAMRRVKVPFFLGIGFSVLNVIAQMIVLVNVYDINRWLVILGTGLLLIGIGVYVERKRENIIETAHEWKETLAAWQ